MRTAMKQEKEIKFPSLTEQDLTQESLRDRNDRLLSQNSYNHALLDVLAMLDKMDFEEKYDVKLAIHDMYIDPIYKTK